MTPLEDAVAEGRRIVEAAGEDGLLIRAVGGVGVALVAPAVARLRPPRAYHDIDLAAPFGAAAISRLMAHLGYGASNEFNTLNGSERLLFHDPAGRRVDVFIDTLRMCHELSFAHRLAAWPWTLPPADLLLFKLQIVELTDRDAQDVLALLADHDLTNAADSGIEVGRVQEVCARDWGWWRTVDDNLAALLRRWGDPTGTFDPADDGLLATARGRAIGLREILATCPKSARWRARAMIGPRMRWYELPEEVR